MNHGGVAHDDPCRPVLDELLLRCCIDCCGVGDVHHTGMHSALGHAQIAATQRLHQRLLHVPQRE